MRPYLADKYYPTTTVGITGWLNGQCLDKTCISIPSIYFKKIAAEVDILIKATVTEEYDSSFILKSLVVWQKVRWSQKHRLLGIQESFKQHLVWT